MKTMKKIQIAVTVVALLVSIKLADTMEPTTNELLGSIVLAITGGVSLFGILSNSNVEPEEL